MDWTVHCECEQSCRLDFRVDLRNPVKIVRTILSEPIKFALIESKPSGEAIDHFCLMQISHPFWAIVVFKPIAK